MAKANIRLLLSSFHLFRHIIPGIKLFPSHYSYELSVQLQTALSFRYKKGMCPPKASQLSVFSAVSIWRVFPKLFLFQEKFSSLPLHKGRQSMPRHVQEELCIEQGQFAKQTFRAQMPRPKPGQCHLRRQARCRSRCCAYCSGPLW